MKKTIYTLVLFFAFFSISNANEEVEKLRIEYEKNISVGDTLKIDVSSSVSEYQEELAEEDLLFEWDIQGKTTTTGAILEESFEDFGIKEVNLNIFTQTEEEKTLLINSQLEVFVYEKSLPFIFSESISQNEKEDFIALGRTSGIYIYEILDSSESSLYKTNILANLEKYYSQEKKKSDFVGIWGEKEFLFSAISKINREQESAKNQRDLKFVLVSGFNGKILEGYLGNLLTNKEYISDTIIINDTLTFQITKEPSRILKLKNQLSENQYSFIEVDTQIGISRYFFLSRFINTLSNAGVSTSDIFILIMIPLLLTITSFIKHMIGVSPIGIIIPLFLSILFYKTGVIFTASVLLLLLVVNLSLSRWINKYNLLYTPKVSFLAIINIVVFFIAIEWGLRFGLLQIQLTDIVYVILFIVISEKLITIIISKELREYSRNLLGTFLIGFLGFMVLSITFLQVFILAYPEVIIFLLPINFMIGRFTGLRVTEYLRFKEIIKNIEEE